MPPKSEWDRKRERNTAVASAKSTQGTSEAQASSAHQQTPHSAPVPEAEATTPRPSTPPPEYEETIPGLVTATPSAGATADVERTAGVPQPLEGPDECFGMGKSGAGGSRLRNVEPFWRTKKMILISILVAAVIIAAVLGPVLGIRQHKAAIKKAGAGKGGAGGPPKPGTSTGGPKNTNTKPAAQSTTSKPGGQGPTSKPGGQNGNPPPPAGGGGRTGPPRQTGSGQGGAGG